MSYKAGDVFEGFKLLHECGSGAFGRVFLAENLLSGQRVALKLIAKNGRNFERELKGVRDYITICRHTDLLQIYHVAETPDHFFYTMDAADNLADDGGEYLPDTLGNRLRRDGAFSADAVRSMARELLSALQTLHDKGVFHRDLKPDNILWINGIAVPGDIGLVSGDTHTIVAGTPGFMSTEVLAGVRPFSPADDNYALGKILYCALTGMPAERFPSFPENQTLADCADIVALYNQLCAGEMPEAEPQVIPRRGAWSHRNLAVATILVFLTLLLSWGGIALYNRHCAMKAQKSVTPSLPVIAPKPETLIATIHQELTAEWKKHKKIQEEALQQFHRDQLDQISCFPANIQEKMRNDADRHLAESQKELSRQAQNLPRLEAVARFYVEHFPDVLTCDELFMNNPFYGSYWLKSKQPGFDEDDALMLKRQQMMIERHHPDAGSRRRAFRRSIYLALRSAWRVEAILADPDFNATLKKQAELLRDMP